MSGSSDFTIPGGLPFVKHGRVREAARKGSDFTTGMAKEPLAKERRFYNRKAQLLANKKQYNVNKPEARLTTGAAGTRGNHPT